MSNALLISSATVIVRAGEVIWLNRFATVLFNVCGVLYPFCVGGWYICCYVTKKSLLQCLQLLR